VYDKIPFLLHWATIMTYMGWISHLSDHIKNSFSCKIFVESGSRIARSSVSCDICWKEGKRCRCYAALLQRRNEILPRFHCYAAYAEYNA